MGFDIMSLLNEESRKAAVDSYKVEMVDIDRIEPSPDNFYNISEEKVLSMCASIDAVGIQQPLLVEEQGGRYQIIAGETRYQAVKRLAQEGGEKYRSVPCRVMREISQEDRKLLLILTNSTQRERTDYEKMLEISTLRDVLQPKKEQEGKGFKMQQSLSEITGMSKSAIGRLDNIRNHLCMDFLKAFKDGELNTSAADAIASLSQKQQEEVLEKFRSSGKITSGEVRQMFSERPCTIPEEELDAPSPEESETESGYALAIQKNQTGEPFDIVDNDDDAESAAELMQQFNIKPDATSLHGLEKVVYQEEKMTKEELQKELDGAKPTQKDFKCFYDKEFIVYMEDIGAAALKERYKHTGKGNRDFSYHCSAKGISINGKMEVTWAEFSKELKLIREGETNTKPRTLDKALIEADETKAPDPEKEEGLEAYKLQDVKNLLLEYERNLDSAFKAGSPQPFTKNAKIIADALALLAEKREPDEEAGKK